MFSKLFLFVGDEQEFQLFNRGSKLTCHLNWKTKFSFKSSQEYIYLIGRKLVQIRINRSDVLVSSFKSQLNHGFCRHLGHKKVEIPFRSKRIRLSLISFIGLMHKEIKGNFQRLCILYVQM